MDVIFEAAALKGLRATPKADAQRMVAALRQVAEHHPERLGFVTELQSRPGYWRARKGDWRPIYRIGDTTLEVVAVSKRAEAYR